jgi:hypothetical protein
MDRPSNRVEFQERARQSGALHVPFLCSLPLLADSSRLRWEFQLAIGAPVRRESRQGRLENKDEQLVSGTKGD